MIIKIIPETEAEKAKHREIEFAGVKEFFMVGNRKDEDGYTVDFHEWEGGYKYLLSSLHWFYKIIDDERKENVSSRIAARQPSPQMIKKGEVKQPNFQVLHPKPFATLNDNINFDSPINENQFEPNSPINVEFTEIEDEDNVEEIQNENAMDEHKPQPIQFPLNAQLSKKMPKPPKPLSKNIPSHKEIENITNKIGKMYQKKNEDQANPDE